MEQLVLAKKINKLHARYLKSVAPVLRPSLIAIVSISKLLDTLNTARVDYNQENKEHEERLLHVRHTLIHYFTWIPLDDISCVIVMEIITSRCSFNQSHQQ
jgi:hypothetical protein